MSGSPSDGGHSLKVCVVRCGSCCSGFFPGLGEQMSHAAPGGAWADFLEGSWNLVDECVSQAKRRRRRCFAGPGTCWSEDPGGGWHGQLWKVPQGVEHGPGGTERPASLHPPGKLQGPHCQRPLQAHSTASSLPTAPPSSPRGQAATGTRPGEGFGHLQVSLYYF